MVKDRLSELQQFHNKSKKDGATTIVQMGNNNIQDESESENKKLRQTFERSEVIGQWIEQIEKNNQDIRIYLKRVDDMKFNQKDVAEKLRSWFQNNTSLALQLNTKLKQVDAELKEIKTESTEKRIKSIQYTTSKTRFEKAFLDNKQLLESYESTQKQVIKSQLIAKGYFHVTDDEVTSLLEQGTDIQVFVENILAETAEAKRILADVEERHQQLVQIERMLQEVRDLFVQMAILIESQQELIDRIDYQTQTAKEYVVHGTDDLDKGRKKRKKYLRRKIYILIALVVLIVILLIILLK